MSRPSHSIPANGRAIAIRHPCVDTRLNVDASGVGPGAGSMFRRPPSLRRVVFDGNCPGFIGTTQTLRLPAIPPAALRLPSLGGTTVAPVALLPCDHRRTSPGRGVVERGHPDAAGKSVEMAGISQVPAKPSCRHAHAPSTPGESNRARLHAPSNTAADQGTTATSSTDFRGSITWLSGSLSTLRSSGLPRCHARLACGCRLNSAARASHPPGFTERFQLCFQLHIASSSRELAWRNPRFVSLSMFINVKLVQDRK
jgi:hypothetical protein